MLVEVRCDKFVSNGKTREPIRFHAGLNAVLGDDNGSNSIGKSTFLMILDFVFGGSDYVKKCVDVQENVKVSLRRNTIISVPQKMIRKKRQTKPGSPNLNSRNEF